VISTMTSSFRVDTPSTYQAGSNLCGFADVEFAVGSPRRFDSDSLGFRAFLAPIDRGKTLSELFKRGWSRIGSTPFF
jgi:hypothetical protein